MFDHGDVDAFAALVDRHRDAYFAQPALANRQEFGKGKFSVYTCVYVGGCDGAFMEACMYMPGSGLKLTKHPKHPPQNT